MSKKVVVVVGAKGLLGSALVDELQASGEYTVVRSDLSIYSDIRFPINVTREDSIQKLIELVNKAYGKIDAVVNCSYPRNKEFGKKWDEVSYMSFNANVSMHLGGAFNIMKHFSLYFEQQGYGNIINIGSIYGVVAPDFGIYPDDMTMPVEYAAIKAGIINLTKYFARANACEHIRVNCVSPGGILDNQSVAFILKYRQKCLNKGMLDPKDVVGTLMFLLSDASMYTSGQNLIVDDGFTL